MNVGEAAAVSDGTTALCSPARNICLTETSAKQYVTRSVTASTLAADSGEITSRSVICPDMIVDL